MHDESDPRRAREVAQQRLCSEGAGPRWSLLSHHAQVLLSIARDPRMRVRDISARTGVTQRTVQNILSDLERDGLLTRHRAGRRNTYEVDLDVQLVEAPIRIRDLVRLCRRDGPAAGGSA